MMNNLSWAYPVIVPYKVENVYIEPTNHCNLRCIMCPHNQVKLEKGFMNWELFTKIVDDIISYNPHTFIQLFYTGEPLLHPRILEMISYLKRNKLRVHLATNATLLDERMAHGLISTGLDFITFSFEGADKKTYESIRVGANYESVLENIHRFLYIKNKEKADVQTIIEIIKMDVTKDKIPIFIKKFEELGVNKVYIKPLLGWAGTINNSKTTVKSCSKPNYPCNRPWRMLAITWDGLFVPCCVDFERKYTVGNANRDSVEDVWNGKKIQYLRKKLKSGQYNEIELCKNCEDMEILSERFTFPEISNDCNTNTQRNI